VDYAPLTQRTFGVTNPTTLAQFRTGTGASNTAPVVGPVVINEIFYHPPTNSASREYLELLNSSAGSVPLYDPAYPTNRWKIGDGIDFTFPTNVTLVPGGYLLVVDFDPTNTTLLANFRNFQGISPGIPSTAVLRRLE